MPNFPNSPDQVAVLDSGFNQVFPNARPVNARVSERSQLFDHPIETGQIITDYSIVLPIEIELRMVVEAPFYTDTYQQIRSFYLNKTKLTVLTKTGTYTDMVLGEMPHDERPEVFDALQITLRFRQVQIVPNPSTYAPLDPASDDTQSLGQQNGYVITGVQTTEGNSTIPLYSSVPPQSLQVSGVQTLNGPQTINVPTQADIPVTGVQAITSAITIQSVVQ